MFTRKAVRTHRSFRWGIDPSFSRGVLLAPPAHRAEGGADRRRAGDAGRDRRRLAIGSTFSLLLHGLFLTWLIGGSPPAPGLLAAPRGVGETPLRWVRIDGAAAEPAGPRAPVGAIESTAAAAAPAVEAPEISHPRPTSLRRRVELDPRPVAGRPVGSVLASALAGDSPAGGGRRGARPGPGSVEDRQGEGGANGSLDGAYTPPRARSVLHTWSPRRAVIGLEVLVRVHLDERGRPTGIVELLPPTPDRRTNEQLVYWTRNVEYHPALVGGRPVAGWAEVSYRFCYDGTTATSPPSPTFGRPDPCAEGAPSPVDGRRSGD